MNPIVLIAGVLVFQLAGPVPPAPPRDRGPVISLPAGTYLIPSQAPPVDEIKSVGPDGKIHTKTWRLDGSIEQRIDEKPVLRRKKASGPAAAVTPDSTTTPVLNCASDYQATTITFTGPVTHQVVGTGSAKCLIGTIGGVDKCKAIRNRLVVYEWDATTRAWSSIADSGTRQTLVPACGTSYNGTVIWVVDRAGTYRADYIESYADGTEPHTISLDPFDFP